jgi:hypothetical protein
MRRQPVAIVAPRRPARAQHWHAVLGDSAAASSADRHRAPGRARRQEQDRGGHRPRDPAERRGNEGAEVLADQFPGRTQEHFTFPSERYGAGGDDFQTTKTSSRPSPTPRGGPKKLTRPSRGDEFHVPDRHESLARVGRAVRTGGLELGALVDWRGSARDRFRDHGSCDPNGFIVFTHDPYFSVTESALGLAGDVHLARQLLPQLEVHDAAAATTPWSRSPSC